MKERGILFSGGMVRAIMEGRKTQTRRVVKPQPIPEPARASKWCDRQWVWQSNSGKQGIFRPFMFSCPYGVPGDRLWVRETWAAADILIDGYEREDPVNVAYRANGQILCLEQDNIHDVSDDSWNLDKLRWRPSIHMPRWASRITLEITDVRVERVQDITDRDAVAEGIEATGNPCGFASTDHFACCKDYPHHNIERFKVLWDSLNSKLGFDWDDNPWVWVLSFKKL